MSADTMHSLLWKCLLFVSFIGMTAADGCTGNQGFRDAGPLVKSKLGYVIGKYIKVLDTEVATFQGIPFAKPPIGEKRFQKPEPIDPWKGVLRADEMPRSCTQLSMNFFVFNSEPGEDCLYLNIWTPSLRCNSDLKNLPVMVWIHGGGFEYGSSSQDVYDGRVLAARGNIVVVSINYRLGVFGFLDAGIKEAPGNAGLHDQVLALKWVKNNIQQFGGNPDSITIFGESAGSWSVNLHLISHLSRNLFHRAILQSGAVYSPFVMDSPEVAQTKTSEVALASGCSKEYDLTTNPSEVVKCLKHLDTMILLKAAATISTKPFRGFWASFGNDFLPDSPMDAIDSNKIQQVDILIGAVNDEGSLLLHWLDQGLFHAHPPPQISLKNVKHMINWTYYKLPESFRESLFNAYFKDISEGDKSAFLEEASNAFGDYLLSCPTLFLAEKLQNAYTYWYSHRSSMDQFPKWMGVYHFAEVPYVFGVPVVNSKNFTSEDVQFSEDLMQMWIAFAKTGYPLKNKNEKWKKFSASQPSVYELNPKHSGNIMFPRKKACEFWRSVFASV